MKMFQLVSCVVCASVLLRFADDRSVVHGFLFHAEAHPGRRHCLGSTRLSARWRLHHGLLLAVLQLGGKSHCLSHCTHNCRLIRAGHVAVVGGHDRTGSVVGRTKLTALATIDMPSRHISGSRVRSKVPNENTILQAAECPSNSS